MNTEVKVGDQTYRIGRLDAFKQFHIARRIAPFIAEIIEAVDRVGKDEPPHQESADKLPADFLSKMVGPVSKAISALNDEDSEYIINTCLSVVSRQQPGGSWAPVLLRTKQLMFDDIDVMQMLNLTVEVIKDSLSGFFPTALPKSDGASA